MMIKTRIFSTALSLTLLAGCASAPLLPERASGYAEKPGWTAKKFMVAAAHPLAVGAGYQVLRAGGSAVDAAIAVQMLLTLVEPQSSGIGGGAFLLHFDGKTVKAFDGRETAPAAATESMFKTLDGRALPFYEGVIGAPGVLRMLELAHRQYGKLPWASLFALAIRLAEDGFTVSPELARLLKTEQHLNLTLSIPSDVYKTQTWSTRSIDYHSSTRGQSCRPCQPGLLI